MIDLIIRDRFRNTPDSVAVADGGWEWTYAEIGARSDELAVTLDSLISRMLAP